MSELPQGWQSARLGDVCEPSQYGYTAKAGSSGNIHFLRTTDITSGPIDWGSVPFCDVDEETREKYLLHDGDVVISRAGSVGFSCLIRQPRPSVFASYLIRFRPRINADYFKYFLLTPNYWNAIGEQSLGIAVQNVNASNLSEINVPVAPAAEQTRIVAKLEELLTDLDAGVEELKAAQKKLGQYRQSLLKSAVEGALTAPWREEQRAKHSPSETGAQLLERILTERRARWEAKQLAKFAEQGKTPPKDWQKKYPEPVQPDTTDLPALPEGWVWASVEQIASDERYSLSIGPFGSNLKVPDYRETGVPLVFVRNIRSGNYGGTYTKYVTPEKAEELSAHSILAGDVLITKMGEPPGDADVYPENQPPAIITADCIKVRCWAGLMRPEFLKTAINSYIGQRQIEPMTQGVAQKKVSLGRFTSLAVPVPPIQEQDQLIALLSEAGGEAVAQEGAIELSLKRTAAQRQNILRAAFSGQLVPQDPNDEPASVLLERIRDERAAQIAVKKPRGRKAKENL